MASLDQIEGDGVELLLIALVVFIILAVFFAWRGIETPLNWLLKLLQAIENWFKQEWQKWQNLNFSGNGTGSFSPFSLAPGIAQNPVNDQQYPGATAILNYLPDWLGGGDSLLNTSGVPGAVGSDPGSGTGVVSMNGSY